jgi:hypothetical protein
MLCIPVLRGQMLGASHAPGFCIAPNQAEPGPLSRYDKGDGDKAPVNPRTAL